MDKSKQTVFTLEHSYQQQGPEGLVYDEIMFIGVYSSRDSAEAAISRLSLQPGFRDYPDCFDIRECDLDEGDYWERGFVLEGHVDVPPRE